MNNALLYLAGTSLAMPKAEESLDPIAKTRPYVFSRYALIADQCTGRILYSKGADERHPPASTTKIMTALLMIEAIERSEYSLGDRITAQEDCRDGVPDDASTADIVPGECLSLEDILYCILLPSANEACNIVAELMCGTQEAFVGMMNIRAQELGCTNTHFSNPSGVDDDDFYVSARDLMLLGRECMRHELFARIVGTLQYDIPATNKSDARHLMSTNALINCESAYGNRYVYKGTYGIKTGYTDCAGCNLISCVKRDGLDLIAVVLGGYSYGLGFTHCFDSVQLYDWAFREYGNTEPSGGGTAASCAEKEIT